MPQLGSNPSHEPVKLLLCGHGGSGKTGLLGSLAEAGYRLFICDFDNGSQILLDPTVLKPEFRKNVYVKVFTDKLKDAKGIPDGMPTAFTGFVNTLDSWKEELTPGVPAVIENGKVVTPAVLATHETLGSPTSWGPKDVVVVDSLTFMGSAAMRYVLYINNHIGKPPQLQHWGEAIRMQEDVIARLYSEQVKCNVIVMAHLLPLEDSAEGGLVRLWPSALGKKLAPKIGRYFNNVWQIEKKVRGQEIVRTIKTSATFTTDLKSSLPSIIKPEEPPNLASLFERLQGAAK